MKNPYYIALLTDFGLRDVYVATMKAVVFDITPHAQIIDITHKIEPQNVQQAAFNLLTCYNYFPSNTIFCCVVDPGVGTQRKAIALKTIDSKGKQYSFVAPDNGLLTFVLQRENLKAVSLDNSDYHLNRVSNTFHGRDIFAPVTAYLAKEIPFEDIGSAVEIEELVQLNLVRATKKNNKWHAQVIYIDHFGNLVSNMLGSDLMPPFEGWQLNIAGINIKGIEKSFASVEVGEAVAYIGSSGFVEIAIRQGNAQKEWNMAVGKTLLIECD